ncbi:MULTISPECIES: MarR family winged helix-turn-helix transcriptional regulator [unclassified Methylobacterium]|jgi:DNA-binding MarR family transcriptional regulator|uniref:MarR family winged helix-turn-helix transcriptional regulator n=1 Tax=unclassified Methylobacterium TaxID=2615210 RepID=UPI0013523E95|nr:MarR family transcriptional regulator [Methylobacterium sp. 2A]MWV23813.1 MarR family transcriptional regulator [Methylobacterium sp. 2A]
MSELPEAGEGKRGMEGHLGYLLRQAAQAHRNRVERALDDLGLTLPQFSVLTMLAAYPGHSNADLARLALLTPQTMSVIVANLLKAALIARAPHQIHGRIQKIVLTDAGQSLLDAAKRRVYALETDMLGDLADAEQAVIRQWLVRIARPDAQ